MSIVQQISILLILKYIDHWVKTRQNRYMRFKCNGIFRCEVHIQFSSLIKQDSDSINQKIRMMITFYTPFTIKHI